ncbi:ExbD/TolR family protein [Cerasicoccus fimbriatus]|uniref:ExbD/TolR family protein n=1 Tax=Cerasicoccus fimbriatus TaxID=3014554 RepID=UPI0022B3C135|nr:biopolymer transporter ExbD [Cerasicoccus sp. TK19100]
MSLVQPLDLQSRLRTPPTGADVAALFDILLIVVMISLLGSRFVFAPGSTVALEDLQLPESRFAQLAGVPTVDVLTLLQDDRVIYDGQFMTAEDWSLGLEEDLVEVRRSNNAILLIKADGRISLQAFLRISDRARQAGYTRVQIAERPAKATKELQSTRSASGSQF